MLVVVLWFPEVRFERCFEHLLAINDPTGQCALAVNGNRTLVCICHEPFGSLFHFCRMTAKSRPELLRFENKLLFGHSKPFWSPWLISLQTGVDIQDQFCIIVRIVGIWNIKPSLVVNPGHFTNHQLAIVVDLTVVFVFIDIREPFTTLDGYCRVRFVKDELNGLINVLHLVVMRMWYAVWTYQAVDTEWAVVGLVAKVTSV